MSSQVGLRRTSLTQKRGPSTVTKKSAPSENGSVSNGTSTTKPSSPPTLGTAGGERTVKKLRLSKALTIPEGTTVSDACRRMAARRVDAVLLTDANALLSGIVTDKDIATRVIAEGLRPENTTVSKIMTRNPIFVNADSLAMEALLKMIQGKFRHLPVVENGEVIALLDITKCLYDAIARMEKAAEQGSAIAAAVEGVERQWGADFSAPYAFLETLRERMFKPSLSTIIGENTKVAIVSPSDPVYVAAKRMRDFRVNSVIIVTGNKIQGILTPKDILMQVVAQNLSPELTLVEKVMTPNPECATLETTILDALHIMHEGKFLHLPVLDRDESVAACVDVLQITHAAISMVESSSGTVNDMANTMMQKLWDSALALEPPDDTDTQSEMSAMMASDAGEHAKFNYPSLGLGNSCAFKFEDRKGRVHRLNSGTENLDELVSAVMQRTGGAKDNDRPQILYEDDEGDRVLLASDDDLVSAVSHARAVGQKDVDYCGTTNIAFKNATCAFTFVDSRLTDEYDHGITLDRSYKYMELQDILPNIVATKCGNAWVCRQLEREIRRMVKDGGDITIEVLSDFAYKYLWARANAPQVNAVDKERIKRTSTIMATVDVEGPKIFLVNAKNAGPIQFGLEEYATCGSGGKYAKSMLQYSTFQTMTDAECTTLGSDTLLVTALTNYWYTCYLIIGYLRHAKSFTRLFP